MNDATSSELCIRINRMDALFQETPFVPAQPDLDPGPGLDHLIRRAEVWKMTRSTPLRVYLASEPVTPALESTLVHAVRAYCQRRAQEQRGMVRHIRRSGRRAIIFAMTFLAVALGVSAALTHFEPLPTRYNDLLSETFVVAGWVLLWRPFELLFYDWITPWRDAMSYERLAELPVELLRDDRSVVTP